MSNPYPMRMNPIQRKQQANQRNPVLSDNAIREQISRGWLFETTLSDNQFQPNSVDLTLADTWKIPVPNDLIHGYPVINPTKPLGYREGHLSKWTQGDPDPFRGKSYYCLEPLHFVLFASKEILKIPNGIVAFVQGRSSIARLGIQTEQAGLIDSGFRGTITFEVYNESEYPIYLVEGMRVAQVYFFKAMASSRIYGKDLKSKYSNQIEATGSKLHLDPELH